MTSGRIVLRILRIFAELRPVFQPMLSDVTRRVYTVPLAVLALVGCTSSRWQRPANGTDLAAPFTHELVLTSDFALLTGGALPGYSIACPDILEIRFSDFPQWDCLTSVDVDGCISVGKRRVGVQGLTTQEAREALATALGSKATAIVVSVADPCSGTVELYGPELNHHRSVAYRGPESVLAFLIRNGALKPGCFDPHEVTILRPNVAIGRQVETFKIDLTANTHGATGKSTFTIERGDQVYIAESRQSSFARLLPSRLRPIYLKMVGIEK